MTGRSMAASIGALGLFAMSAAVWASAAAPQARREVLPDGIAPLHYDLALAPDAESLTFKGRVTITIDVATPSATITLNAAGLVFDHASVDGGHDAQVSLDKTLGRAMLAFGDALPVGRHRLAIEYHGQIGRSTTGFFAMDYTTPEGAQRTLATNFEPADARDLLPCWDEPARKATFTVSIDAPKERMALSNMPIAEVTPLSAALQRVRFVESPKMSTYLLFVGVGDFERVHSRIDDVDVGVVVQRGDIAKAAYALEQASQLLHYYNDYFGVRYPLPKLDLIAAPGQIEGGSMENWGAIFYSQNQLLFDPKVSTELDRQTVFEVVAHEMAHQWFGDLVTMAWWDDLWLNEGFARWMQTYAADDLHPEWETGLQAFTIFERGKRADSMPSTHPVVQQVDTADQANQSFDDITYDKGAALITMINAYVGRDKFRDGVRAYMHAHAFGNTVDTDLWSPMQAAGLPIVDIERDFTRQEGLPLVRVTRSAKGVRLVTGRFADDPATLAHAPPQHWRLPLALTAVGGRPHQVLVRGATALAMTPPLLVNAGQLGYARVLYSDELLRGLTAQLAALPAADQLGLLNDTWALGMARALPASHLMDLAAALPAAANPVIWNRLLDLLAELDRHYRDTPQRVAFRHAVLGLLGPLAARIGPRAEHEPPNIEVLRQHLEEARGALGDSAVIASARQRLDAGAGTPAEQRAALDIVAAQADAATFDMLLRRAQQTADPLEKMHQFRALAGVADPALARRMTDIALGDQIPAGSTPGLLGRLSLRHADLLWEVVGPRLDDPRLPLSKIERWDIAAFIAADSAQPQRITDLEAYEARSVPEEARKPFLASVAQIHRNQRITDSILPDIDHWIESRQSAARAH